MASGSLAESDQMPARRAVSSTGRCDASRLLHLTVIMQRPERPTTSNSRRNGRDCSHAADTHRLARSSGSSHVEHSLTMEEILWLFRRRLTQSGALLPIGQRWLSVKNRNGVVLPCSCQDRPPGGCNSVTRSGEAKEKVR